MKIIILSIICLLFSYENSNCNPVASLQTIFPSVGQEGISLTVPYE
jgi:hypothetical protein